MEKVLKIMSKSDVLTKTLEAMSERSDTILRQLITNQEKISMDMDKQHEYIANMNSNFSKTAAQVEKMQTAMNVNQENKLRNLGSNMDTSKI